MLLDIVRIAVLVFALLLMLSGLARQGRGKRRGNDMDRLLGGQAVIYGLGVLILWSVWEW